MKVCDWAGIENEAKAMDIESLQFCIEDCKLARDAFKGTDLESYYQDQATVYYRELRKRLERQERRRR